MHFVKSNQVFLYGMFVIYKFAKLLIKLLLEAFSEPFFYQSTIKLFFHTGCQGCRGHEKRV